jgi:hypothetical protein
MGKDRLEREGNLPETLQVDPAAYHLLGDFNEGNDENMN